MHGKLKKEGSYELFMTTQGHEILTLDKKEWYAVVKTSQGHILVKSDSDHKKSKTVDKGQYYLADFNDDPEFQDMPHLFLKDTKTKYKEFVLPQGLPTSGKDRKKVIVTDDKVKKDKVEYHVKGSGDKGSEKQYQDNKSSATSNKQDLSDLTKKDLYEKAKKQHVTGRSKMSKKELIQHLN
ncbi:hypothetical protein ACFSKU_05205 [Pontibacter silvestris]|uniref:Rho termination factor N-terminal domain-containing protein n=1 Tax=Pontibacter silvestris TaxID=2305183 RepID=A0ABW4WU32_9BACT|nr:hypothetical protein [Pontibacter silvestris]MCC9136935.1 hypothetical protein [Pontibacter silvestris]